MRGGGDSFEETGPRRRIRVCRVVRSDAARCSAWELTGRSDGGLLGPACSLAPGARRGGLLGEAGVAAGSTTTGADSAPACAAGASERHGAEPAGEALPRSLLGSSRKWWRSVRTPRGALSRCSSRSGIALLLRGPAEESLERFHACGRRKAFPLLTHCSELKPPVRGADCGERA